MAHSPPRDLDWEMLALKMALIDPEIYNTYAGFRDEPYSQDQPSWVPAFTVMQQRLGIYPLNAAEGDCIRKAVWKLMGK